jgi:AraC family transcriptional regulator
MMSVQQSLAVDYRDWPNLMPYLPVLTSFQAGWNSIQVAHHRQPSVDLPEMYNPQHIVVIPLKNQVVDWEFFSEGQSQIVSYREEDFSRGCVNITPANLPYGLRSHSRVEMTECIHCYLEPEYVAQIAHESVNSDHVELLLTIKRADLFIQQIGLALKSSLEEDRVGDRFYADSLATALAAHLVRHYSTRNHCLREYEDGLSKQKLKQAIAYIDAHLGEDLSLNDMAHELGMSQYYFCHLFKRSMGLSPHQFLIRQRVERAKRLLKQPDRTITAIALDCGFANQSHFARYFRQCTGMNPNQFRKS